MIASLSGTLQKVTPDYLIVQVNGIGFKVYAPRNVLEDAGHIGRAIRLSTHFLVRENEMTLYGFNSEEDQQLFEVLLTVNGVGPKVGLAILSTLSPELLKSAIMREETAVLQRVPGIGKKTAERLMFQLRDKLDLTALKSGVPLVSDLDADVIEILTGLGFSIVESQTALQKVPREVDDMGERVQAALQHLDPLG